VIQLSTSAGKSYRISGLTLQPLNTITGYGLIKVNGNSTSIRLDHCHFQPNIAQTPLIAVYGLCMGVADHNVIEMGSFFGGSFLFYNGVSSSTDINGDVAWSNPTNFGGSNFFFVEDNYISNTRTPLNQLTGFTDGTYGCRYVLRHNHLYDIEVANHGTEGGRYRGGRALEMYNNDFHNTTGHQIGGIRSGCLLTHDNTFDGVQPGNGMVNQMFRSFYSWGPFVPMPGGYFTTSTTAVPWGGGSGDSPWDFNDVRNAPYSSGGFSYSPVNGLYASGTVTSGTSPAGGFGGTVDTLTDTSKTWTTNQWVGFTARRLSDSQIGLILANTSNTLTMYYITSPPGAIWQTNDQYQIHKALILLDQQGRGKCDLITGTNANNTVNSVTGTPAWSHQALEPVYSWKDIYTSSSNVQTPVNTVGSVSHSIQANRDYYNMNAAWTPGTPVTTGVAVGTHAQRIATGVGCTPGTDIAGGSNPPGVGFWESDTNTLYVCTATNTWTQYYQPYTYPHPLVSGATPTPAAPTNLRITGP
jgi:hypothetical protein